LWLPVGVVGVDAVRQQVILLEVEPVDLELERRCQ
jgi:hypothetical protein